MVGGVLMDSSQFTLDLKILPSNLKTGYFKFLFD